MSAGDSSPIVREAIEDVSRMRPFWTRRASAIGPGAAGRSPRRWITTVSAAKTLRSSSSVTSAASVVAIQSGPRAVVFGGRSEAGASSQAPGGALPEGGRGVGREH